MSGDGEIEDERSLEQMLRARPDIYTLRPPGKGRRAWDPLHSNSLRWLSDEALAAKDPIYALGNIIQPHDAVVLDSGNTLISESNKGRAFEVTLDGDIVWEYFVPYLSPKGHRQVIVRLYRYETDLVEKLLNGAPKPAVSPEAS